MDDAKIEVSLDLAKAKAELDKLKKEARERARAIASAIGDGLGRGFDFVGLGGGTGMVMQSLRGPTQQAYGGIISEAFGAYGKQIEKFFLGDLGAEARAGNSARESTIEAFGMVTGMHNQIPQGAREYFQQIRSFNKTMEVGRDRIEADPDFRGVSPGDIVDRVLTAIGELLSKAVKELAGLIVPVGGR